MSALPNKHRQTSTSIMPTIEPLERFKRFYQTFDQQSLDELDKVYAKEVMFTDPVHVIHGCERLEAYFKTMCGNLTECRFEFIDETVTEGRACFKWNMFYRHPRIKGNAPLQITGVSLIEYSDKIDSHEDFYDMGAMLYEHLPIMGTVIRKLKACISKENKE